MRSPHSLFTILLCAAYFTCSAQRDSSMWSPDVPEQKKDSCFSVYEGDTIWVYACADVKPEFPGGMEALYGFLIKNIKYPQSAREDGVQGKVYLRFYIEKNGAITNVVMMKGALPPEAENEKEQERFKKDVKLLDAEAIRILELMPAWDPGHKNGRPIKVEFMMPIKFSLGG
jgi:hypothetical protein